MLPKPALILLHEGKKWTCETYRISNAYLLYRSNDGAYVCILSDNSDGLDMRLAMVDRDREGTGDRAIRNELGSEAARQVLRLNRPPGKGIDVVRNGRRFLRATERFWSATCRRYWADELLRTPASSLLATMATTGAPNSGALRTTHMSTTSRSDDSVESEAFHTMFP